MNAETFIRRWIGLAALFAGLIALAPYFVHVVVANSGCQGATACAGAEELLGHYARRITLVVVIVPLLLAVASRTLATGGFGWAFPFALLMTAGALPLAAETRDLASMAGLGTAAEMAEMLALVFLLLLLIAFSAHPDDSDHGATAAWRTLLGFVALAALFVTAPVWTAGLAALPYVAPLGERLAVAAATGHAALGMQDALGAYATYCMLAFVLAAAGLLFSGPRAEAIRPIRPMRA
ncbi:hypothetical protein ACFQ1E_08380 [Sphingomonas canadensis]|uniref:Cytochrome c oxidase assembly protein n=1 Tax=Sphingomonas canadensis TaxID=1219257 RepID=A0ABW3H7G9_9SPHN|nr:hypothetical protein [Sphingomonas canadensis]MCW3836054.1 hypothetical protein [Sphingomonas canadensis]